MAERTMAGINAFNVPVASINQPNTIAPNGALPTMPILKTDKIRPKKGFGADS